MTRKESKTVHEAFSRFFENPTRESFRSLLKEHVGELRNCDFKEDWLETGALAKHVIGIANAGGGCLIFGVKENADKSTTPQGIQQIKDKADISNSLKTYLPEALLAAIETADFKYDASEYPALIGKLFQVIFVYDRPENLPFVVQRGTTGLRAGAIYVRREGQTEEASYEEVQNLIHQKLQALPKTEEARGIKDHLEELKVLYAEIPRERSQFEPLFYNTSMLGFYSILGERTPNPNYPKEDYQAFVKRIIAAKKALIESALGLAKNSH